MADYKVQSARFRRVAVVLMLATFSVSLWAGDLRRIAGHPLGRLGFDVSFDDRIVHVDPKSSAFAAGVREGAAVVYSRMPLTDRLHIYYFAFTLDPGDAVTLVQRAANRLTQVRFATDPEPAANRRSIPIRAALALVLLFAGILVVLRRPSHATWAFFVLSLLGGAPVNVISLIGSDWYEATTAFVWDVFVVAGSFAGPVFALYLLHEGPLPRWRRACMRVIAVLALIAIAAGAWSVASLAFYGIAQPMADAVVSILATVAIVSVPLLLFATYLESSIAVRERLRWLIAGFSVFALARAIDSFGGNGQVRLYNLPYTLHSALLAVAVFAVAFSVIYAVLKHRIIDINVAISRALVYGVLSAVVIGVFAFVDMFFSRAVSESKAGFIADIALALIIGFFFNGLHARVDRFVDGLVFRRRHLAERHIDTVIASIPYAKNEEHVNVLLTQEPRSSFDLTGALLMRCNDLRMPNAASLVAYLEASRTALRLHEHGWHHKAADTFDVAIAAPVFSHGELHSIALYGFHRNGTDLDSDEIAFLERLTTAAGAAYDHLEAQALRREVEELRAELAALRAVTR